MSIKNEYIIWAYAERLDGKGQVLIIGLTHSGLDYLRAGEGENKKSLVVDPPGRGFTNITQVVIYNEKDKATLKATLQASGITVSEVS